MPAPAPLAELLAVAHDLADAARAATLAHFRQPVLQTDNKARDHFDPVTAGDRAAEAAMRMILARRRPHDAVLGEEFGTTPGTSGLTWILDPIDGTRAFMAGAPTWGVLISVSDATGPLLGIIDQPHIGERFVGTPGTGMAELIGPRGRVPLRARAVSRLDEALLFTTFPEIGTPAEAAAFGRLARHCRLVRYGLDCYAYGLLAAGHVDLVVEAGLQPYDIAAPIAVITAAGGIVTDWHGRPAHGGGQVIAAANAGVHAAALALLAP